MAVAQTITGVGAVLDIIQKIMGIMERMTGYIIANAIILPEYEKLTLSEITKQFIKNPEAQKKLEELFKDPEKLGRTEAFIEFLREFNLKIAKTSLAMGIVSPTWAYQTSQLLNAVAWSFGFGWLSWIGLSPILNNLVANPASTALQQTFPSKPATRSVVEYLYKHNIISKEQLVNYYIQEGYTDEAIQLFLKKLDEEKKEKPKDLTKTEILRAYRLKVLDRAEAKARLIALGYSDDEAELLLDLEDLRHQLDKKERNRDLTKSDILSALKLGLIQPQEAKDLLISIGYDEDEAEFLVMLTLAKIHKPEGE